MSKAVRARGEHERHYELVHRTTHTYPAPVTGSYGLAMLLPRDGNGQRVHRAALAVSPAPAETAEHLDLHGNRASYFHVTEEHTTLEVVATSLVTVTRRRLDPATVPQVPWERAAASVSGMRATGRGEHGEGPASVLAIVESALPSELVAPQEAVREFAMPSFGPGTPLVRVAADLAHRIATELTFRPGSTTVRTPLAEVLERRTGACRDFAHVLVACMRSMGLAARYVAGYLETPPTDRETLRGEDPSHAWAAVWVPGGGWVHVDPTNDRFIDSRYVVLGWGRDHLDVAPLRGVVYSSGQGSTLSVGVELRQVSEPELQAKVR